MDLGFSGKRALLLGAGRGIGAATGRALAREGCSVALVARTARDVQAVAADCEELGAPAAAAITADATAADQLGAAVAQAAQILGGLDILVTLVGGSQPGGTADLDDAAWNQALGRNLWPAIRASRLALPHLAAAAAARAASAREPSVIVHVSSIWGREGGGPLSYNAAKAALISLAHAQARELAPQGIRVLSVAPGSVLHPGGSWERRQKQDPAGIAAFVARELPFGRFGTAEELGDALAFLCSPKASWIAGTCVVVDGAQSRAF